MVRTKPQPISVTTTSNGPKYLPSQAEKAAEHEEADREARLIGQRPDLDAPGAGVDVLGRPGRMNEAGDGQQEREDRQDDVQRRGWIGVSARAASHC